jgi:Cellulose binding domain
MLDRAMALVGLSAILTAQVPTVRVEFNLQSSWSTAYQVEIRIVNQTSYTIYDWTLEVPWQASITSIWNGSVAQQGGGRTRLAPVQASWEDGDLSPGEIVAIGLIAAPPPCVAPTTALLNGYPVTIGADSPAPPRLRPPPARPWPDQVFAPYLDVTLWPPFDFSGFLANQGARFFHLAFVVAETGTNRPSWGGYYPVATDYMMPELVRIRQAGGDASISFGGASGTELAQAIQDVSALQAAYQSVIDAYELTHVDFDIEGAAIADAASVTRRSRAIAGLQSAANAAGRELYVSFTLPVLPTGLTADGVNLLASALQWGVQIHRVNIMAMDYGNAVAPNGGTMMGAYAIQAATALQQQLQSVHANAGRLLSQAQLWAMVGVTPMLGLNDVTTEVFRQSDAQQLLTFAQQRGIGQLSYWSLSRDRMCAGGASTSVSPSCSSIVQTPYEFCGLFRPFTTAAWRNLGGGSACSGGSSMLVGTGMLTPGSLYSLQLQGALPAQLAVFVLGFSAPRIAVPGGTLVPQPDLFAVGLADVQGRAGLSFVMPQLPPGLALWQQAWIPDANAVGGACLSNAVVAFVP